MKTHVSLTGLSAAIMLFVMGVAMHEAARLNFPVMQKFIDQSISANTSYDPSRFEGQKVPMKQLLKDLLTAYKYGVKTLYYHNTRDGAEDAQLTKSAAQPEMDDCAGGACKI